MTSPRELPPGTTTAAAVITKTLLFGVAGWAAENLLYGPRYSAVWQGHHVPFLPVYAAGGLAMLAVAPHLTSVPAIGRAGIYAAMAAGLEYTGCQIDRKILQGRSWDYRKSDGLAKQTDGCVDWNHTALWGLLGLLGEGVAR
jgi:uncharacterized membrane protein